MTIRLVKYETARIALKEASQVDEVKDIHDKAQALAAYARQVKNDDMMRWVTDIKLRAERRMGELLNGSERNKGAAGIGPIAVTDSYRNQPTLDEIGISKKQSSDYQAIATIPEEQFEEKLTEPKMTTSGLVRSSPKKAKQAADAPEPAKKKARPDKPIDEWQAKYEALVSDYNELKENRDDLAGELKTCEAIRAGTHAIEMQQLREYLKICTRRRDELMANAVEMRKSLTYWKNQAEKLGWKSK